MSKDLSVTWTHHPATTSQLRLLSDIIAYAADRIDKPHVPPREPVWPHWARKLPIPPVKYFGNVAEFAAAMGRLVADAEFLGRDNQIPARDICDVCGAVLGELGTCPCDECSACGQLIEDPELGCSCVEDYENSRDICGECGTAVGELGDCQCDDEPLEITPATLKATLDRMHAALTQDEGVAG